MNRSALRKPRNYEVESGTFTNRICQGCAYKHKGMCTINNVNISFLRECPDGYTVELCNELRQDSMYAMLTGKHTSTYYNWKPNFPDAPYPVRNRRTDDEDDEEYIVL